MLTKQLWKKYNCDSGLCFPPFEKKKIPCFVYVLSVFSKSKVKTSENDLILYFAVTTFVLHFSDPWSLATSRIF